MMSGTGLVPERDKQIMYRLIFNLQRIVINVGGRNMFWRTVDLNILIVTHESTRQLGRTRSQQTTRSRINAALQGRVGGISQRVAWACKSVEDPAARIAAQPNPCRGKGRVETGVCEKIEEVAVIADSPAAANDSFVVESGG